MSLLQQIWNEGGDSLKNYFEVQFDGLPAPVYNKYKVLSQAYNGKNNITLDKNSVTTEYNGLANDANAVLRVKKITLPTYGVKTADINFYTTQIRVPVAKMEFTPEFTITFRVDRNWAIYQALMKWRNSIFDPESGYVKFDSPNALYMLLNQELKNAKMTGISLVGRCKSITVAAIQATSRGALRSVRKEDSGAYWYSEEKAGDQAASILRRWRFNGAYPTKVEGVEFDYSTGDAQEVTITFAYLDMVEYYEKDSGD